ncbi:hypothetical protein L3Q82_004512 [Scortum barcoo]|uniref:Uncharacterized protein n=1 Tax=Scortum barcoo TaxID=214431 RepID=A0ACB8VIL6_9TELE|nr:hypothetical protein L3Q82_004512 [Scortum barcoo]
MLACGTPGAVDKDRQAKQATAQTQNGPGGKNSGLGGVCRPFLVLMKSCKKSQIANEAGDSNRHPLARFARSRSQNALCTIITTNAGITDHKGILIDPRSTEEILADELPIPDAPDAMEKTAIRRLVDPEDDLSDIQSDSVPSEVRDWLALTFTRQRSLMLRRNEDKPRFRSIVHAVQAGIFVERDSKKTGYSGTNKLGTNKSKRPIINPKEGAGKQPLSFTRGELQYIMAAELGSYKQAHTNSPPLTLVNSRVVEGPAPLKELGSRAQAAMHAWRCFCFCLTFPYHF